MGNDEAPPPYEEAAEGKKCSPKCTAILCALGIGLIHGPLLIASSFFLSCLWRGTLGHLLIGMAVIGAVLSVIACGAVLPADVYRRKMTPMSHFINLQAMRVLTLIYASGVALYCTFVDNQNYKEQFFWLNCETDKPSQWFLFAVIFWCAITESIAFVLLCCASRSLRRDWRQWRERHKRTGAAAAGGEAAALHGHGAGGRNGQHITISLRR